MAYNASAAKGSRFGRLADVQPVVRHDAGGTTEEIMLGQADWNGSDSESYDLLSSVQRNCACEFDRAGARVRTCPAHDALVHSQRFLDGLLFARRILNRLIDEEWSTAATRAAA
jgi:hypothetical protein